MEDVAPCLRQHVVAATQAAQGANTAEEFGRTYAAGLVGIAERAFVDRRVHLRPRQVRVRRQPLQSAAVIEKTEYVAEVEDDGFHFSMTGHFKRYAQLNSGVGRPRGPAPTASILRSAETDRPKKQPSGNASP